MLAVLAGWQLRHYSAASDGGTAEIDPVLALAPALALAAGSVATLRLLPLAARTADWLAVRGRRLTASLASWQLSRMPVRQASAALLLTMAVATGTLALAQHASWLRSASDQAAFATGGDVQVDPPAPLDPGDAGAVTAAQGRDARDGGGGENPAGSGEVIALDAAQAAQVVRLRADESPLPPAACSAPSRHPAACPGPCCRARARRAGRARSGSRPRSARPDRRPRATAGGRARAGHRDPDRSSTRRAPPTRSPAGTLVADGRPHVLVASLGGEKALYPLRVASISVAFQLPLHAAPAVALTLSGLSLAGWTEEASSPYLSTLQAGQGLTGPAAEPRALSAHATPAAATFIFSPGYGFAPPTGGTGPQLPGQIPGQLALLPPAAPVAAIPAIATRAYMDANNRRSAPWCPRSWAGCRSRCESWPR